MMIRRSHCPLGDLYLSHPPILPSVQITKLRSLHLTSLSSSTKEILPSVSSSSAKRSEIGQKDGGSLDHEGVIPPKRLKTQELLKAACIAAFVKAA